LDRSFVTALIQEHRAIEVGLDLLAEAIRSGRIEADATRELADLIARHYLTEERFLTALGAHDPKLAAKLRAQHDHTSEIGARLLESLEVGDATEAVYLSRRFIAIAQHNIIEEERDVFRFVAPASGSEGSHD
jgi:hypothetical protein